jgi:hypothetical protein
VSVSIQISRCHKKNFESFVIVWKPGSSQDWCTAFGFYLPQSSRSSFVLVPICHDSFFLFVVLRFEVTDVLESPGQAVVLESVLMFWVCLCVGCTLEAGLSLG